MDILKQFVGTFCGVFLALLAIRACDRRNGGR